MLRPVREVEVEARKAAERRVEMLPVLRKVGAEARKGAEEKVDTKDEQAVLA